MRLQRNLVFSIPAVLVLSACAVTQEQCDPHNVDASLSNKFNCSSQGVYQQRVDEKEKILLDEQQTNAMFRSVYEAIEKEKALVGQELSEQQNQYSELNNALGVLLADLKKKAEGSPHIEEDINQVEKDLADINNQDNPSVVQKQLELEMLRSKVTQLETDLGLR